MSKMPFGKRLAAGFISGALLLSPIITGATDGNGIPKNVQIVIKLDLRQKNILQENILEELSRGLARELSTKILLGEDGKDEEKMKKMIEENENKKSETQKLIKEIAQNSPLFAGLQFPEDMKGIFSGEEPMIFVEMEITDEQWKKLLELKAGKFEKSLYKKKEYYFYSETYFSNLNKSLIIANQKPSMEAAIDASLEGNTLSKNSAYMETAATFLENDFISIYLDPPTLGKLFTEFTTELTEKRNTALEKMKEAKKAQTEALKELGEITEKSEESVEIELPKKQNMEYLQKIFNSAKTFGASFAQEKTGIQIKTIATYDKEKLKELGLDQEKFLYTPSLYKKSPIEKPMLYLEVFNLAEAWEIEKEVEFEGMNMKELLEEITKEFKKETGLDLEKEVIELLDKEIIFVVGEQKNLIPSVSLMADIKTHEETAKKTLKTLKKGLEKELKKNKDDVIWEINEKNIAGGEGYEVTLDAPEEEKARDPMAEAVTPIKFSFGITQDNVLYLSTDEAFETNYAKGVNEENILKSMDPQKKSSSRFYMGLKNIASWFKQLMTAVHDKVPEKDRKYFDLNEVLAKTDEVAAPWEDIIIYSTGTDTAEEGTLFVHADIDSLNESYLQKIIEWGQLFNENETHYENYTAPEFQDVSKDAWYHNEVKDARIYGITKGYEDRTFRADRDVTRAEFLAMAMRSTYGENNSAPAGNIFFEKKLESFNGPGPGDFKDVPATAWYYQAIRDAKNKEIISGYSDSTFHPDEPISRAEAAQIMKNILEKSGFELETGLDEELDDKKAAPVSGSPTTDSTDISTPSSPFPDIPEKEWYSDAVRMNNQFGIMKGGDDGNFAPFRNLNRAESAALMIRLRMTLEKQASGKNIG